MKYCALDIGNVLVHADFHPFLNKLSKSLNLTLEEANYFMNRTQKLHDLGYTQISDELQDHFKIKSPIVIEEMMQEWNDIIVPNYDVINRITNMMKHNNLKVALLSNIGIEHAVKAATLIPKSINFFSCYVGARKPSLLYYHTFLQLHPEFWGCPYIDDLQENLDAGKQFGFQTYRFCLDEIFIHESKNDQNYYYDKLEESILEQPKLKSPRWH